MNLAENVLWELTSALRANSFRLANGHNLLWPTLFSEFLEDDRDQYRFKQFIPKDTITLLYISEEEKDNLCFWCNSPF